jgi:hypothetical protein
MIDKTAEQIWIPVNEAAEMTGYTPAWLTALVKDMLLQPEDERPMQIRQTVSSYEIWLPDFIEYVAQYAAGRLNREVKRIWVSTTEGAEITGYNRGYINKLARDSWRVEENQRLIRVRRKAGRYDIWLPDLMKYMSEYGYGPIQKKRNK